MEPTSDIQFIAQQLIKTQTGDQVTVAEQDRLADIAENGHTTGRIAPRPGVVEVVDPAHVGATRVHRTGAVAG